MRQGFLGTARVSRAGIVLRLSAVIVTATVMVMAAGPAQASTGTGSVSATLGGFVELSVTDGSIAALSATPTSSDPGPRAYRTDDGFQFSNGFTNTRALLSMDITSANDGSASSTKTVQNTVHTIADWIYVLQDGNANFATYQTTGTFDATAGDYTAPAGFDASQGTLTIRAYDKNDPADEGDQNITVNWAYDSGNNQYYFDAVDKDFTNGNGEELVHPSNKADEISGYTFTAAGNTYAVTSVGDGGSNFVPTIQMGWEIDIDPLGSVTNDAFLLIDFPSGTPTDTYSITMTAAIAQLTS